MQNLILAILFICLALPTYAESAGLTVANPQTDGNGVIWYDATSSYNGPGSTPLRVLAPTNPAPGVPHRFIYVLPAIEGVDLQSQFGDGLEELRALNVHNNYNAHIIAPSFKVEPWYANHTSNPARQYESFMAQDLVPWVKANLSASGQEQHWLIGFSKSGFGAVTLLFRNPTVFDAAAAWDFPADQLDAFDCNMLDNYGTDTNFQTNYRLTNTWVAARKGPFQTAVRLWLSADYVTYFGIPTFRDEVLEFADILDANNVQYLLTGGASRTHSWTSGWLPEALASLQSSQFPGPPPGDTTAPGRSNGVPTGTLPAGTTQTSLSLATDEGATCRYTTTPGVAYSAMPNTFTSTGGTAHITTVSSLTDGVTYSFFVRCKDTAGNANSDDFPITFSVAQLPGDTTAPGRSNGVPTGTLPAGTTQTSLSLATDEGATCRYTTTLGVAYSAMPNTFTSTGGTAHITTVSSLTDGVTYSFFVRCKDTAGNANSDDFPITFSVAQSHVSNVGDDFNRADGALGPNWLRDPWWGSGVTIIGNKAGAPADQGGAHYWAANGFSANQYSQATLTGVIGDWAGVVVRGKGSPQQGYWAAVKADGVDLYAFVNGVFYQLVHNPTQWGTGDVIRLAVQTVAANTARLVVYQNGSVLFGYDDAAHFIASGQPGIGLHATAAVRLDDWIGGELTSDLPPPSIAEDDFAEDDFNRADGALGPNWLRDPWWGSGVTIIGNKAGAPADQGGAHYWAANGFSANQYSQATLTGVIGDWAGVVVRGKGSPQQGYWAAVKADGVDLYAFVNGVFYQLVHNPTQWGTGDVIRLAVQTVAANTARLVVYQNGSVLFGYDDAAHFIASGQPGIGLHATAAVRLDDWIGGELTSDLPPLDITGPLIAITSHTNNQTVTTSTITVAGTASDSEVGSSGISSVTVNGALATSGTASGASTATWSRAVTLTPGANTIMVVANDASPTVNSSMVSITVTYQPVTASPNTTTVLTGTLSSGTAAALTSDNNIYYTVNSTTAGTRTATWYGSFPGVSKSLSKLRVNYKGNNSRNCTQTVAIWRWTTSTWMQLDSRTVGTSEVAINNLAPTGTLANYVSGTSSSGELRVRIQCQTTANFTNKGDLMSIVYDMP